MHFSSFDVTGRGRSFQLISSNLLLFLKTTGFFAAGQTSGRLRTRILLSVAYKIRSAATNR